MISGTNRAKETKFGMKILTYNMYVHNTFFIGCLVGYQALCCAQLQYDII